MTLTFDMKQYKMSAFIPVHKSMLAIGPEWLDRYVREYLAESMAIGLETAIIAGTGLKQPTGMMKDMTTLNAATGYGDKTAKALPDLSPKTLGSFVMAPLTNGGKRQVSDLVMIVNPLDYWNKIFSATAFLTQNGTYAYGVLPIPARIIQCAAVPEGKLIAGLAKDYFMGVGSPQKMLNSDEAMFLEDKRVYAQKIIANGRPLDNNSFLIFDISKMAALQEEMRGVYVKNPAGTETGA